jgi:hypothetical protein
VIVENNTEATLTCNKFLDINAISFHGVLNSFLLNIRHVQGVLTNCDQLSSGSLRFFNHRSPSNFNLVAWLMVSSLTRNVNP